jgi:methyl-accepting chemotaxis protein
MKTEQISIRALICAALIGLGVLSIGLSVVTSFLFRDAALDSQAQTLSRVIKIASREVVRELHKQGVELGNGAQNPTEFRSAIKKLRVSSGDDESRMSIVNLLNVNFHQRYATAGILSLKKVRAFDASFKLLGESGEGMQGFAPNLPDFLLRQAQDRKGSERYKPLGGLWNSHDGPVYSVLVPIGGLRLLGYLEVVLEPSYNLRQVSNMMQVPLLISDTRGNELFKTEDWEQYQSENVHKVHYDVPAQDGSEALRLTVLEDATSLFDTIRKVQLSTIALFVLFIVVGLIGAFWVLGQFLFRPMGTLVEDMNRCARGDLTVQIEHSGLKDLRALSQALGSLVDNLRNQVRGIQHNAKDVSSSAGELNVISQQTMEGMDQQQLGTQELASAMNEMVASVQEVAGNAIQAAEGARAADEEAVKGKQVVAESINSIESLAGEVERAAAVIQSLDDESESIGSVLDVIRGIAEQTNLLALNAAIEAARAGEHGRGFAVVADEVRTLAGRTQQSTLEIQTMIERLQGGAREAVQVMEQSRNQAQSSVEQATRAGDALNTIAGAVTSINDVNRHIASATEEQNAVAEAINRNVTSISAVTEQTGEGTQKTASHSESLTKLAEQLKDMVSQFKV